MGILLHSISDFWMVISLAFSIKTTPSHPITIGKQFYTLSLSHVMCFKFIHPPWAVKKVWGIPIWYVIKKWNDDLSLSLIFLFKFLVGWSSTMSVFAFATQIWWTDTGSCRQHRAMLTAHQLGRKAFFTCMVWLHCSAHSCSS